MRAIVTGATGFLGSHLVDQLVARGHRVVSIGRPESDRRWLDGRPVEYVPCGVHDEPALTRVCDGADVVFHFAGCNHAPSAHELCRLNVEGTAAVMRAAAAHGPAAPHVILASSIAAVGPCRGDVPLSAETVPRPVSLYGSSKLAAEAVVHSYAGRVPATILRLPSVYGPRDRGLYKLFRLLRRGVAVTVGAWDRRVSLIYVRDLTAGALAAARATRFPGAAPIYYLTHPEPVSWEGFAHIAGQALGREPILVSVPRVLADAFAWCAERWAAVRGRSASLNRGRVGEIAQRRWVCDGSRAVAELGFRPAVSLEEGVRETVEWYRAERWL